MKTNKKIIEDYFCEDPIYDANDFPRCFAWQRNYSWRWWWILKSVIYFKQKPNGVSKLGISSIQKWMVAIKILAYGFSSCAYDEYIKLANSTTKETLEQFLKAIRDAYLHQPIWVDVMKYIQKSMKNKKIDLAYLDHWIACTISGRIALPHE